MTARCYEYFTNEFTKLSYGSPLQKLNYIGKCLWYSHPSHGSVNCEITAKSQKTYVVQLPILPFGLVAYARGFKIRQRIMELAVNISTKARTSTRIRATYFDSFTCSCV